MDEKTKKKVEATVLDILRESVSERKVLAAAADRLGIDLSAPDRRLFVRGVFEGYLRSLSSQEEEAEETTEKQDGAGVEGKDEPEEKPDEDGKGGGGRKREHDGVGDLILCRLATNRRVTLSEFRGKKLVSIRDSYLKDGKELPTSKGISLTVEQWEAFHDAVPAIEDAISKLGGSE